jgi:uncharacterized membrane protein
MLESKLKDRCPACGVPRQMFEPYADPMSESRRKVLDFHLHPIAVHFPTSFVVAIFIFSITTFFFRGPVQGFLICATKVMGLFLPLLVLIAFLVGLLDGKIRFRRFKNSLILRRKILFGSLFFIFSLGLALFLWLGGLGSVLMISIAVVLAALGLACTVILALLGMQILNAAFPG